MTPAQLASLTQQVLWAAFFVAMAFGALVQRTGFCTMGAISDVATMGDWTRLRQWALAAGVAMVGFALLSAAGLISPDKTLYASNRWIWLSALVGGAIFGVGMVLASGCASKALVRVGGGNLKALVVVLVLGISAFATLKGLTAVWRNATVDRVGLDFETTASLPAWAARAFGISPGAAGLVLALLIGGGLIAWACLGREFLRRNNLLAGAGVGGAVVAMWWVTGHWGYLPEHPRDAGTNHPGHQLGTCRSAELRFADRLHAGLADVLQRPQQAAHRGHRLGVRRHRRLGRGGAGDAALSLGGLRRHR